MSIPVRETEQKFMAFSKETIEAAWRRAGGKCECRRKTHNHAYGRCNKTLSFDNRGKDGVWGAWEAHHITAVSSGGSDTLSNCEILCIECHKNTGSYGG